MTDARFSGVARLVGRNGMARLSAARVTIVGVGGVGAWVAESLARSGVGRIDLIDLDDVCVSNTNRQLHALNSTVGQPKVEVMAARLRDIHPAIDARPIAQFFTERTADALLEPGIDVVVDAIDSVDAKCLLIRRCREMGLPIVVCGGAGGRRDPSWVKRGDLADSAGDRLLATVRKRLRQDHDFPRKGAFGVGCVYSAEPQVFPTDDGEVCVRREDAANLRLDCASGYGTASFVTGAFGLHAAAWVVDRLTR